MIGLPDRLMSSRGQKNLVCFYGFYALLQVKGRFLHLSTAVRLRCPAETSPDGADLFLADRGTHCACAVSATGSAQARGPKFT